MSGADSHAPLRRGWTTGACASGAARAAFEALLTGVFPDPVPVALPKGLRPAFALAKSDLALDEATAGVVKDAGDDPDVTHGALILATVRFADARVGRRLSRGAMGSVRLRGPACRCRPASPRSTRPRAR